MAIMENKKRKNSADNIEKRDSSFIVGVNVNNTVAIPEKTVWSILENQQVELPRGPVYTPGYTPGGTESAFLRNASMPCLLQHWYLLPHGRISLVPVHR